MCTRYITRTHPFDLFLSEAGNDQSLHDVVIKGATDDQIPNYDRTIPTNYRRPDEVWPTSTGDDNALMIPRVSYTLLRRSPGKFREDKREKSKTERDKRKICDEARQSQS